MGGLENYTPSHLEAVIYNQTIPLISTEYSRRSPSETFSSNYLPIRIPEAEEIEVGVMLEK